MWMVRRHGEVLHNMELYRPRILRLPSRAVVPRYEQLHHSIAPDSGTYVSSPNPSAEPRSADTRPYRSPLLHLPDLCCLHQHRQSRRRLLLV